MEADSFYFEISTFNRGKIFYIQRFFISFSIQKMKNSLFFRETDKQFHIQLVKDERIHCSKILPDPSNKIMNKNRIINVMINYWLASGSNIRHKNYTFDPIPLII